MYIRGLIRLPSGAGDGSTLQTPGPIPNRPKKGVEPPYNRKRAVLNGYKIRFVILTNRERLRSNEACGDSVRRPRGRWGVSTTQIRDTTPYIGLQTVWQRPARGRYFGHMGGWHPGYRKWTPGGDVAHRGF